ncbi:MAG: PadR family transcriptional regulator [Anaerolineales bacterium]
MKHKRHGHHNRFWHRWHEQKYMDEDERAQFKREMRTAWRDHFAEFLGTPPEDHWLFGGRRFKPWATGTWGPPGRFNPFVADLMSKGGGLLPLIVLHLLSEMPRYGNDIMREIEERTQGHWGPNPGAIYPLLTLMEDGGLIAGDWEDPNKRTRRIYRLTDAGKGELVRLKEVMRPKLEEAINILRDLSGELENNEE